MVVEHGDVLLLTLEDSPKRLQQRLESQLAGSSSPVRLHLAREWPRGQAGIDQLEAWLKEHPEARLIVIDTLARFRDRPKGRERGYSDDYADIEPLQRLATRLGVAIVVVHHQRKLAADDWIDTINGTLGLAGAADGLLGLFRTRGKSEAELKVTGRDLEEQELGLQFDPITCTWSLLGAAERTVAISSERRAILDLLRDERMTPTTIAKRLNKNLSTTKNLLRAMVLDGLVFSDGGTYAPARARV